MKRLVIFGMSLGLVGAACTTTPVNDWQIIAEQDITGDTTAEVFSIKPSNVTLDSSLQDSYQYAIDELTITSDDTHTLLQINQAGITSEDGTTLKPVISTQAAYALGLGKGHVFYVVQIDSSGKGVSEPITFNWDVTGQTWKMGK